LSIPSTSVAIGTTFVDGPRRSTIDTVPVVVGFHVMGYGVPTGTISPKPGLEIGFPDGSPTGVVSAAASEAADARRAAVNEKRIFDRYMMDK
jgi:hypothetical protein